MSVSEENPVRSALKEWRCPNCGGELAPLVFHADGRDPRPRWDAVECAADGFRITAQARMSHMTQA